MTISFSVLKTTAIILVIGLMSYVVGYFASLSSDAFREARFFIRHSPEVIHELGSDMEISLSPFGYELEFSGSQGKASFDCNVAGSREKGVVHIVLQRVGERWMVKNASLHVKEKVVNLTITTTAPITFPLASPVTP